MTDHLPVQVVPISSVQPAPDNPRKISPAAVDLVAKSLQRFGWKQPIICDKFGTVVAGHTRLQAAQQLGLTQVPVVIANDLTPDECKALRIADNRTHDFSTWDLPQLAIQVDELAGLGFSEELAVADWAAVMDAFTTIQEEGSTEGDPVPSPFDDGNSIDMPADGAALMGQGTELVLVFQTKEQADQARAHLLDLEGVVDVRDRR